jgi:hypothetical protein
MLVASLCFFHPALAAAQDRPAPLLLGVVVDSVSGAPISAAAVLVEGRRSTVLTDTEGRYAIEGLEPGEYVIAAVTRDCRIGAVRLSVVEPMEVRLDLTVGLQRLEGAERGESRARAEGVSVRVTTREEIQRLGERSLLAILRRLAPLMVGAPSSRPGEGVRMTERGVSTVTGSREPLVLLDGVRVTDLRVLEPIDPGSVIRIDIAQGAAGGWAYGREGVNGIIQIRTLEGDPAEEPYCGALTRRG